MLRSCRLRPPRNALALSQSLTGLVVLVSITQLHAAGPRGGGRDALAVATGALGTSRSEKVRVQAALVLGRTRDERATPALIHALGGDPSAAVRAMAAKALGDIGDDAARGPLEAAADDRSPLVRHHVAAALDALTQADADATIAVRPMGDATNKAPPELRERMRRFVEAELHGFKKRSPGGYSVDGAIKSLGTSTRTDVVEVKCAVELILSTGRGGGGRGTAIVMMSSGEATVQKPKRQYRPAMQPGMVEDALEHAVRGASDELRQHFAANGP